MGFPEPVQNGTIAYAVTVIVLVTITMLMECMKMIKQDNARCAARTER
jgi:hypothetical protein